MTSNIKLAGCLLATSIVLAGCDGNSESMGDITVNVEGDVIDNSVTNNNSDDNNDGGDDNTSELCAEITEASFVSFNDDCSQGTVTGTIDSDYTFIEEVQYVLSGVVTVGAGNVEITSQTEYETILANGVTLTVEPGSDVKGTADGVLLVTRGSKLIADGYANNPITFSSLDDNYDGMGEWGGVVIQGFAPQYGQGGTGACFAGGESWCNVLGEGGDFVQEYGGSNAGDDSGIIRYVRIAEGGLIAGPDNEINGLTLQGVGHGTQIDYVQVQGNQDDGIEWFGGTVNVKHAVLTNNDDDDIDFDEGYQGNIQYALIIKNQTPDATPVGSNDPRGIELNSSDDDHTPETAGVIANVTIIGGDAANYAEEYGMRLRGSVTAAIHNSAVTGYDVTCARIDDSDTDGDSSTPKLDTPITLNNFLCDTAGVAFLKEQPVEGSTVIEEGISFDENLAIVNTSALLDVPTAIAAYDNGSAFIFDETRYIGAVDPSASVAWWADWTLPGSVITQEEAQETSFVSCNSSKTECTVSGTIDEDYTMVNGVEYRLDGVVTVGAGNVEIQTADEMQAIIDAGVTLTIRAGVEVKAFDDGVLLVTRGSKLIANGSSASPITFSSIDPDYDGMGEWGGVVIQGFAPQYGQGGTGACFNDGETWCNVLGEGGDFVQEYGGNLPGDDSGIIRYVRIAEGGLIAGPNNEINGLTLQGVGHDTLIDYVQVHGNQDDGIEWFGGTVNVKHALLTNNDDDDIDFDEGYQGNIQYALIIKNQTPNATPVGSNDPRGIELNSSDDDYTPETAGVIANVTIIGGDAANYAEEYGMRLRGSVTAAIHNSAVTGYDVTCARIDDSDTDGDSSTAKLDTPITMRNFLCDTVGVAFNKEMPVDGSTVIEEAIVLDDDYAITNASASVTAEPITAQDNGSDFEFDATDFIGAVKEGATPWYSEWAIPGSL
ncbi:hypothetical protein N9M08_02480 [Porticoccaceae bacterium]|nr:hypothetical protein [Porticoccaceae bacterium]MDB2343246.1 hypothetical protein [Porticoccaceae bacterium]MDB2634070.1 hypothetical protein [Porticoccaceae bacterium]MDB2663905.1 hypothetical protein [Porticoccaceae bacterium]